MNLSPSEQSMHKPSDDCTEVNKADLLAPCFHRNAYDETLTSYHNSSIISHLLRKTIHNKLTTLDSNLLYLPTANVSGTSMVDSESSVTDFSQDTQSRMSFKDRTDDLSCGSQNLSTDVECPLTEHLQAKRARVENIIRGMAGSPNSRSHEEGDEYEAMRCRRDALKENKRKQRLPQHQEPSLFNGQPNIKNNGAKTSKDEECHKLKEQLQSMQRLLHQLQEKISHVYDQNYCENEEREDERDISEETLSLSVIGKLNKSLGTIDKDKLNMHDSGFTSDRDVKNLQETLKCELTRTVSETIDKIFRKHSMALLTQSSQPQPCQSPEYSETEKQTHGDSPPEISDSDEMTRFESTPVNSPEHQTEALSLVVRKPSLNQFNSVSQGIKRPYPLHQSPFQFGYNTPFHDSQILEHLLKYGPHSAFSSLPCLPPSLERSSPDSMDHAWESVTMRSKVTSGHLASHHRPGPPGLVTVDTLCMPHVKMECGDLQSMAERSSFISLNIQEGLTPNHLKKAKLMFFYTRYPSSNLLKNFFPDVKIELQSMKVDCKVASRFAHTTMTTKALNVANDSQEVFFEVDLPKTAFITNFTIEIEGQVYISEVKEKEKARQQYEKAVSSGQSAGLVKAFGRHMEKFSVSVNVAAQSLVTFTLTYEELLRRRLGSYEIMIGVRPKQLVQNFEIVVDINEPQGITFVDVNSTFITNELLPLVDKTVTVKKAHVYFSPTLDQQRKCPDCEGTLIDGDFFIKYDLNHAQDIGEIQIVNGYFVHFFAPENLPQIPKNVVFVIDRSGSMEGEKMKQTREALLTILSDLHEDDYFGLVTFDDVIESWRPLLSKATPENVTAAKEFVKTITARHLTDINKAVLHAVDMLTAEQSELLPDMSMIILLTDGRPSAGQQDLPIIQENVHNAINGSLSLFCLGFGYDVDYSLLDTMAKQNDGLARRVYEGSDATLQLQGFYEEVASPLLLEVNLSYPADTVTSLTDSHFKHFFKGSEIVVAGRLQESEIDNFMTEVSADGFVVKGLAITEERDSVFPDQEYIFGDFMEHLWAYLTIQQLLDKRDKCSPDEKDNITAEALDLSLRYHFVTPLTSMVVTKPQTGDEETLIADKLTEEEREDTTEFGHTAHPYGGVLQTANAQVLSISGLRAPIHSMSRRPLLKPSSSYFVDGDPHFIIEVPDQNDALCFNFDDKPGTIFNLVRDPLTGIVVNGQIIGEKKAVPGEKMHTYFGSFGIVHEQLAVRLMVSTKEISVSEEGKHAKLSWSTTRTVKGRSINLKVMKDQSLTVTLRDSVKFLIILHKVWENHPYHQNYLGFYTLDSHLLSKSVHGLLGQFYHGVNFEVSGLFPGKELDKQDAIMFVKGNKLTVTRGLKKDFRQDVKNGENVPCWFIHNNGIGLLDGLHKDYIMSNLFQTI